MTTAQAKCKFCEDRSCAVSTLNDLELAFLSDNIAKVHFEKGEPLFKQDTLNSYIVYIRKGVVKVHMHAEGQKEVILKITPAPAFLGLPTIFGDRINQYSATAVEPTDACCINIETFKKLIHQNGAFAYELIADISKDELCNFRNYVDQAHKQVPGRLAGALIYFSEKIYFSSEFELPLNRNELAELIGTSRESATRNLHQLKESGIISLKRNRIQILKPDSLKAIHQAG